MPTHTTDTATISPLNLMIGSWAGLRYYLARNYDGAIEQSRDTVDLDSNFAAAHLILGETEVQQGNRRQGQEELRKAASLSGDSPLYLAQVGVGQALAGEKHGALRTIHDLQNISGKRYVSPYGIAQIYAALNDKEQTYKWLETAYRDHSVWMSYLAVDPVFDSIRSEPPFQGLLRRVGPRERRLGTPPVTAWEPHSPEWRFFRTDNPLSRNFLLNPFVPFCRVANSATRIV